jgi:two-component system NarL family sensor kinase
VPASGEPLLFETYLSYELIDENRSAILGSFARFALLGLVVFALFQVSLAYANLRFLQRQRTRLRERTVQIAESERRRVARDLHDGVVQDLVGASYVVGGAIAPVHATGGADLAEALRGAVGGIRTSIQGLRSMIMEIYPASLRSAGLRAALSDLVAPVQGRGTRVTLDLPDDLDLPPHVEAGIFRAAQEVLRNAVNHGRARTVQLSVGIGPGHAVLIVRDDGVGFDPARPARSGHVGLQGLADLLEELGGVLEVASARGRGTEVRMELPP